ncbi:hypothetical protein Glove_54g117 [Diversispora epigaea]|uniref:TLDc domain-containing protein n=1 Tax=Diversispora epigaea TaxID=1348612 RepID=A0A397JNS5_9GLOM|nr:hypothetical protein Glove_54g117 [Diversispora epigaea]
MCHGNAGTIVVTKVTGNDQIVGDYNPLAWDNSKVDGNMINTYGSWFGDYEFMISEVSDFTRYYS